MRIALVGLCLLCFRHSVEATLLDTNLPSKILGPRHVQVYLPPSYASSPTRRYPVLYLHDGQNVFSSAGTNCAFGWGSWELDTTMEKLAKAGKMREIIMVGVDNNGATRLDEYSGRHSGTNRTGKTRYEKYAEFLITELKPWVDKSFRTQPEAANTAVMGSSMGGLCSVVLAWEHPEVFGGAASLSGAFMMNRKEFVEGQLERYKGKPKTFRLYLDSGTIDFTGGDDGRKLTGKVAAEFQRIGWGTNLQSFTDSAPLNERQLEDVGLRRDKWPEAQVSQHNEFYWRLRAWRPLTFLFPPDHARK